MAQDKSSAGVLARNILRWLAHDLAGPLGAVQNGLELAADPKLAGDARAESLALSGAAAQQAVLILRAFRLITATQSAPAARREACAVLPQLARTRKISLRYHIAPGAPAPATGLLCALTLALICRLPPGASIEAAVEKPGASIRLRAQIEPSAIRALAEDRDTAGTALHTVFSLFREAGAPLNAALHDHAADFSARLAPPRKN